MKTSLHFGLNSVNPQKYGGWNGRLMACQADANALATLFSQRGYRPTEVLLDTQCTQDRFRTAFQLAASSAVAGDDFVFSYSGHGGQIACDTEADGYDETLCLWDGEIRDDEIRLMLAKFRAGVRVAMIVDSCHSGGMQRSRVARVGGPLAPRSKAMPSTVAGLILNRPKALNTPAPRVAAGVVLLSACAEAETASDGDRYGAFTECLLDSITPAPATWASWARSAKNFCAARHPAQHPQLLTFGTKIQNCPAL